MWLRPASWMGAGPPPTGGYIGALAAGFPRVQVEDDVLFVDHGDVATSAGTSAGLDMCLHVVRSDHGAARAARIARHMVMPPQREGDQRQYAVRAAPVAASGSLADMLDWAGENLGEHLTLDSWLGGPISARAPWTGGSVSSSASARASGCSPGASTQHGSCWRRRS